MPCTSIRLTVPAGELADEFAAIRAELELPDGFPADVLAEAERMAGAYDRPAGDMTQIEFVTLDPKGSTDLDQALQIERAGKGYTVRYAIADVPAFVAAGGAVDGEARRRGQTLYAPDHRIPLHPQRLSEDAASLLPGRDRPAFVWTLRLDSAGAVTETTLERALVHSRAQLDYDSVQRELDAGTSTEPMRLLLEVGALRREQEAARGGASLALPEQEIVARNGGYELRLRPPHAIEDAGAQLSLMTGMAGAQIMLAGGTGILRTMPPAPAFAIARLRGRAHALGSQWPKTVRYGDFLRGLDPGDPRQVAILHAAGALFRGAGYTPFDGGPPPEDQRVQAAIAAPYAHVTAPLRRLVDRFALVCCEALSAGRPVPEWCRAALPELPAAMQASDRRAGALERACVDTVEAALLAGRVGERFGAGVVELDERRGGGLVQLTDPPILARASGELPLGERVQVRLVEADVARRLVRFERV